MEKIRFIVATRTAKEDFFTKTATGKSLCFYDFPFLEIDVFSENKDGLPIIYNAAIEGARTDPAILVFAHDDLHIIDFFWADRIRDSLREFQVVGLAGNVRRVAKQPGWPFVDEQFTWDSRENLSGMVGHGKSFPPEMLSNYGDPGRQVKLLDGMLLAARSSTLIDSGLRFDERFDFHFYDLDFCREAERRNISMGTMRLPVIHESGGSFGTEVWRDACQLYLDKWRE